MDEPWFEVMAGVLKQHKVDLVTYVPDNVLRPLIDLVHADPFFTAFAVAREEEGLGINAGRCGAKTRRGTACRAPTESATVDAECMEEPARTAHSRRIGDIAARTLEARLVLRRSHRRKQTCTSTNPGESGTVETFLTSQLFPRVARSPQTSQFRANAPYSPCPFVVHGVHPRVFGIHREGLR